MKNKVCYNHTIKWAISMHILINPMITREEGEGLIRTDNFMTAGKTGKIVAIACSTGGPRALLEVIPKLPKDLNAPVLIVQHMPDGFTHTLAERLDSVSEVNVKEAEEGDVLQNGHVYLAKAGWHMEVVKDGIGHKIHLHDEPYREGVRPCANYMYESLAGCGYDEVICVVMTGMGADGTEGIEFLQQKKPVRIVIQNEKSCVVFGMPGSIVKRKLKHKEVDLKYIANEIIFNVGV